MVTADFVEVDGDAEVEVAVVEDLALGVCFVELEGSSWVAGYPLKEVSLVEGDDNPCVPLAIVLH